MAISGLGFTCRTHLPFHPRPYIYCVYKIRKRRRSYSQAFETLIEPPECVINNQVNEDVKRAPTEWKKFSAKELGISTSSISKPTREVLNELRKKRYEVYLVGGCVRDLILNRTPKDFDVITSAELREVRRIFPQCKIVGRRFPICHVDVNDTIIEVSSFSTSEQISSRGLSNFSAKQPGCSKSDYRRWMNCLKRDFTVNGLMFDPYEKLVYDYIGGMEDLKKAKVRTVTRAYTSFQEDCARILRAVRITARLGFTLSKETSISIRDLSGLVLGLDKGRLLMEMNYMLAFGSAEASLRLLWKFGLLEMLLPIQAAYFVSQGFRRRDKRSNMLLSLFSNLDRLLAPDRPCESSLWVGILVFHKAVVDYPRDPLVVATFTLAVHNGGDLDEAVSIARKISRPHDSSFHELLMPRNLDLDEVLINEVMDLATSVQDALSMMTDKTFVSQAMAEYSQAPYSDLVFIPVYLYASVRNIFGCVRRGKENKVFRKHGTKINYKHLGLGNLQEVRHTFARVVFDTVYPLHLEQQHTP